MPLKYDSSFHKIIMVFPIFLLFLNVCTGSEQTFNVSISPNNENELLTTIRPNPPETTLNENITLPLENVSPTVAYSNVSLVNITSVENSTVILASSMPPPVPHKPPPGLGLHCTNSSECPAKNSDCIDNICSCVKDYITSMENLRCLKRAGKLDDECSEDVQCTEGLSDTFGPTTCLNFRCACGIGMSLVDGKCQGPTVLNTNCTTDDDCTIKRSFCTNGLCTCQAGYVPNSEDNVCLPVHIQLMKLSGSQAACDEDVQCQSSMGDSAICAIGQLRGTCECKPGTHIVNSKCMDFKDLGDECSYDEECVSKDVNTETESSRICNRNKCSCNTEWVQVESICKAGASQIILSSSIISLIVLVYLT